MATATLEREQTASEELVSFGRGENIGLQARLLIGGTLLDHNQRFKNPKQHFFDDVTIEHLVIKAHSVQPVQKLSDLERTADWKDREGNDFQKQKDAWAQKVIEVMVKKQDFFKSDAEGRRWKELYGMLGVSVDGFNLDSANILYDRFFGGDRKGKEIGKFVDDILNLDIYKDPSDNNHLNFARVKADLDAYAWLGNIFGKGTSIVTTELIAAQARVKDKAEKPKFAEKLNQKEGPLGNRKSRIDSLSEIEKAWLEYIHTAVNKAELNVTPVLQRLIQSVHTAFYPPPPEVPPAAPHPPAVIEASTPTTNGHIIPDESISGIGTNGSVNGSVSPAESSTETASDTSEDDESSEETTEQEESKPLLIQPDEETEDEKDPGILTNTAGTPAVVHSPEPPQVEIREPEKPADFVGLVNFELRRGERTILAPLEPIAEYLKKIRDKDGNGISNIDAFIRDGHLYSKGTLVSGKFGEFLFLRAVYGNSPDGIKLMEEPEIILPENLNWAEKKAAPRLVKGKLKQLHNMIVVALNEHLQRTFSDIKVDNVQFEGNKVKFTFKKK